MWPVSAVTFENRNSRRWRGKCAPGLGRFAGRRLRPSWNAVVGRNYSGAFPEKSFEHRDLIVDALTSNRHGGYWDERDVGLDCFYSLHR
jgi:hypothetical protein